MKEGEFQRASEFKRQYRNGDSMERNGEKDAYLEILKDKNEAQWGSLRGSYLELVVGPDFFQRGTLRKKSSGEMIKMEAQGKPTVCFISWQVRTQHERRLVAT